MELDFLIKEIEDKGDCPFERYLLTRHIRTGAESCVFEGHLVGFPEEYDKSVVIIAQPEHEKSLENHFKLKTSLKHPGIVPIKDFDLGYKFPFVVEPFIEDSVEDLLGGFSEELLYAFASQMFDVFKFIHGRGVVHKDFHPGNIRVSDSDSIDNVRFYLTDFGMAKSVKKNDDVILSKDRFEKEEEVWITNPCRPPELLGGKGEWLMVDDLYALATTLFRILTGKERIDGFIDPKYRGFFEKANMKDRDDRFRSVEEMRFDWDGVVKEKDLMDEVFEKKGIAKVPIGDGAFKLVKKESMFGGGLIVYRQGNSLFVVDVKDLDKKYCLNVPKKTTDLEKMVDVCLVPDSSKIGFLIRHATILEDYDYEDEKTEFYESSKFKDYHVYVFDYKNLGEGLQCFFSEGKTKKDFTNISWTRDGTILIGGGKVFGRKLDMENQKIVKSKERYYVKANSNVSPSERYCVICTDGEVKIVNKGEGSAYCHVFGNGGSAVWLNPDVELKRKLGIWDKINDQLTGH